MNPRPPMTTAALALTTIALLALIQSGCAPDARSADMAIDRTTHEQRVDIAQLLEWPAYGSGTVTGFRDQALILREADQSHGVTIVSPDTYGQRLVLRYHAMALRPGAVLVAILSASDPGGHSRIDLPDDYDGAIGPWIGPNPNYFFAFHNAPHMRRPFVNRFADGGVTPLAEADRMHMTTGRWHAIEVGRWDGRLWLKIDGRTVLQATDDEPLGGGQIALRIRGTGPEIASAMIRDLRIITPAPSAFPDAP